jgi:hypothetical protein
MKLEFSRQIFEKQTPNFLKIRQIGDEVLHSNGQTDIQAGKHDEANGRFLQFCERA